MVSKNTAPKKTPEKKTTGPRLHVRSVGDRFRRCGRAFDRSGTLLDPAELSEDEIATLVAEPNLVVEEVEA